MATIVKRKYWTDTATGKRLNSTKAAADYKADHPGARLKEHDAGWQARVRRHGHRPLVKSFSRKIDAELWANTVESEIGVGRFVDRRVADKVTIGKLIDTYETRFSQHKAKTSTEKYRLKTLKKELGYLTLNGLKPENVVVYADKRLRNVASASVERELSILSDVLRTAQAFAGVPLSSNPVAIARDVLKKQRRLVTPQGRARRLEPDEQRALLAIKHRRPTVIPQIIEFALETAMRCGEIAAMRRPDINWTKKTLFIPASKTDWKTGDRGRAIPLSSRALEILRTVPARMRKRDKAGNVVLDDSVWGYTDPHSISQAFARTVELVNRAHDLEPTEWPRIENLRFHDLRHEAITRLFENGMSPIEVQLISGHRTMAMLVRYTHLRAEDLQKKMA